MNSDVPALIEELKRRRVFRAVIAYGVVAFTLLQITEPIMHGLHWPDEVLSWLVVALAIGFPIVVGLAWIFDVNAGHIERTQSASNLRGPRLALTLAAISLLAAGPGLGWYFLRSRPPVKASPLLSAAAIAGMPSIAVLPFVNLSSDKEQEYFSDGIAEELLNALARVKRLKVAGRTSSFQFKGKNEDARAIGEALGVGNLLEGSVRKQGGKVRITAELIQASDGFHLWSNSYDGELTDVFELQERIARAITEELKVVLQGDADARLVPKATDSPEAYALYLEATSVFNRRDGAHFVAAIANLQQAVKLDPQFARAYARLAELELISPAFVPGGLDKAQVAAEQNARRAVELDGTMGEPHAALAQVFNEERRFLDARAEFLRALELEPDDPTANFWYGTHLVCSGYRKQGDAAFERALAIDPALPNALLWRGTDHAYDGDLVSAERLMKRAQALGLAYAGIGLSALADIRGDKREAAAQLTVALKYLGGGLPPEFPELLARGAFGEAEARAKALAELDAYLATKPSVIAGIAPFALLRLGEPVRAFELFLPRPTGNDAPMLVTIWSPYGRAARTLPDFGERMRQLGLADLWERYGAPDGCLRVAPRDYSCL